MMLKISWTKKYPRVALDIDDTLVNFYDHFKIKFPKLDLTNDRLITKKVYTLRHDREFWENLDLIEMPDFTPEVYCTKRVNEKRFTRNNLKKLGLPIKPIYQVYNQSANKARVLKGVADILIDDSIQNVEQCLSIGFPAALIDRPHNRHPTDLPRVKSLNISEINEIYKQIIKQML